MNLYEYFRLENPIKDWDGLPLQSSETHNKVVVSQWWGTNGQWYQDNGINIKGHNGIDIAFPKRTEVVAPIKLWITYKSNNDKGYGKNVWGQTKEQEIEGKAYYLELVFGHFDEIVAETNRWYEAGELLGYGDSTGFSTGHHLHLGIRPWIKANGNYKQLHKDNGYFGYEDPEPYFIPKLRWTIGELESLIDNKMRLPLVQNKNQPAPYFKDVFAVEYDGGKKVLHKIQNSATLNLLARLNWTDGWDKITQINSFEGYEFGEDILIIKD